MSGFDVVLSPERISQLLFEQAKKLTFRTLLQQKPLRYLAAPSINVEEVRAWQKKSRIWSFTA